jgi:arabinogalactan endo-1,4-beta-galactosidase
MSCRLKVIMVLACTCLGLLCSDCLAADTNSPQPRATSPGFMVGADLSWVPQQEAEGRHFSVDGKQGDLLAIVKEHGLNAVRLRLFVDPTAPSGYSGQGYCGLKSTLEMARRVKSSGLRFLLDLHYSDTWADPSHQTKPASWRQLDFAELTNVVFSYTRDTLTEFVRQDLAPEIVQVGNEISSGFLWPDGKVERFEQLAALFNAGARGVRTSAPMTKVMLHLALGGQNEKSRWFLDQALTHHMDFDILGQSYYPRWHGTLDELRSNLTDLATRYRQEIMVVEYSTPNIREVNEIVRSLPGNKGRGTFIWEPTHPRHGNLFDGQGAALPALQEYRSLRE